MTLDTWVDETQVDGDTTSIYLTTYTITDDLTVLPTVQQR